MSNVENPGPVGRTPRSDRWISASMVEPQPCDMLSPSASEGFHTSQVKVPPRDRMLAQPSVVASARHATRSP